MSFENPDEPDFDLEIFEDALRVLDVITGKYRLEERDLTEAQRVQQNLRAHLHRAKELVDCPGCDGDGIQPGSHGGPGFEQCSNCLGRRKMPRSKAMALVMRRAVGVTDAF